MFELNDRQRKMLTENIGWYLTLSGWVIFALGGIVGFAVGRFV